MNDASEKRLEAYQNLHMFFETYAVLTRQVVEAVQNDESERIVNLLDMRNETLARIESYQALSKDAFETPFEEERDPNVRALRVAVRALVEECQHIEEGLGDRLVELGRHAREEAAQAAASQRKFQNYAMKRETHSRYVEERK